MLLLAALGAVFAAFVLQYLVPHCLVSLFCRDQDLVKRYGGAKWGLVTGASSGERGKGERRNGKFRRLFFFRRSPLDPTFNLCNPTSLQASAKPSPASSRPRARPSCWSPWTTNC